MAKEKQELINKFFEAYASHDMGSTLRRMWKGENINWYFHGNHPVVAGVKRGLQEVIAFYDQMGALMGVQIAFD